MRADELAFKQPHQPRQLTLELPQEVAPIIEAALEDVTLATTQMLSRDAGAPVQLKLIIDGNAREEFEARYANLCAHYDLPEAQPEPLETRNWVSHVQKHFKPIRAGRFYIYGSHIETRPPLASVPILLDAGAAFGTGEHETTKGCLLALDALLKERRPSRVLDMGAGSGVLAMAVAKAARCEVDAVEIDPVATDVARANIKRNAVLVQVQCGRGYTAPLVRGEYDLVLANILARPLMAMARDLRAHLAPGGVAVLSGLLIRQERMVLSAHLAAGLRLKERKRLGPWSVLVLQG